MAAVVTHLSRAAKGNPQDVFVIADFASFGAVSFGDEFDTYKSALEKLAQRSSSHHFCEVKAVFNDETVIRQILDRQFPKVRWDDMSAQPSFVKKVVRWLSRPDVEAAVLKRGAIRRTVLTQIQNTQESNLKLDRRTFFKCAVAFNESLIEQFDKAGMDVKRYAHPISVHIWLTRSKSFPSGIIGILDFGGAVDEVGISVCADVGQTMWSMAGKFFDEAERRILPA